MHGYALTRSDITLTGVTDSCRDASVGSMYTCSPVHSVKMDSSLPVQQDIHTPGCSRVPRTTDGVAVEYDGHVSRLSTLYHVEYVPGRRALESIQGLVKSFASSLDQLPDLLDHVPGHSRDTATGCGQQLVSSLVCIMAGPRTQEPLQRPQHLQSILDIEVGTVHIVPLSAWTGEVDCAAERQHRLCRTSIAGVGARSGARWR
eukprot:1650159-Prymnesium_polylepis.1